MGMSTLALGVHLLDRFLAHRSVGRGRLPLLGVSCLVIAMKFEMDTPPPVRAVRRCAEFSRCTARRTANMEAFVLRVLSWRVMRWPTLWTSVCDAATTLPHDICHRVCRALMDYELMCRQPRDVVVARLVM